MARVEILIIFVAFLIDGSGVDDCDMMFFMMMVVVIMAMMVNDAEGGGINNVGSTFHTDGGGHYENYGELVKVSTVGGLLIMTMVIMKKIVKVL